MTALIDRRTVLRLAMLLGLASPMVGAAGCSDPDGSGEQSGFDGSVLIIGAGAAGLSAGHLLAQRGIDFRIVEANGSHGGRMRQLDDWVDFPLPLGAEWLHDEPAVLADIVNDESVSVPIKFVGYSSADTVGSFDQKLTIEPVADDADVKFVGSSWLDFFDEFVVPSVAAHMTFDTPITKVDYTGDRVVATDTTGASMQADAVIVTAPVTILRDGDIEFVPPLDERKQQALKLAKVWGGFKMFIEFSERFYPTFVEFPDSYTGDGQRLYYDAAHGQATQAHVLGLFSVGAQAEPYQQLTDGVQLRYVLAELDNVFDGAATRSYVRHVAQDWNNAPYIRQAYLADNALSETSRVLAESVDGRVFFAGDAYTKFDDWSEVHVAARSAREAVIELTQAT